jgi:hypothetical protein
MQRLPCAHFYCTKEVTSRYTAMRSVSTAQERQGVYAACVKTAVELSAAVGRHILAKAGDSMLRRAASSPDATERRMQIEAERLLADHREAFRSALPDLLQREIDTLEQQEATKSTSLSFGALELMGEEQVDETVEALRSQQMVLSAVEADLGQLNALISAARGRDTVTAAANPLRPEAWANALRAACEQCGAPAWARARWLAHLSEALGPELASVYRQLCDLLTRQGVSAASFTVNVPIPARGAAPAEAPAAARAPAAASAPPVAGSERGGTKPVLNLRDLRRLLAAGDSVPPVRPSSPQQPAAPRWAPTEPSPPTMSGDAGLTVPYAFEAMQQMTRMGEIIERMEQRRSSGELGGDGAATTPAQALGQEVVRVMIDKMAEDTRLLPQVREAVRQLEPALQRLVAHDPRFLRDKDHPGRRFLTEMTERSLAWTGADLPGFAAFFEPLRQAVLALAQLPMENAEPFDYALQSLIEAWDQQQEPGRRERANAARALMKAERRNLLARRLGERLRQRGDIIDAPAALRRFLVGPWAQVMAAAQMADQSGASDPGGYAAVLEDLLRTTGPDIDAVQRAAVARRVPGLVAGVRGGLASIEFPEDKAREFLRVLNQLHRAALTDDGVQARARDEAPAAGGAVARGEGEDDSDFWLEPTEARASSLMEIAPAQEPHVDADGAALVRMAAVRKGRAPLPITRLQAGAWVDLYLDGAWGRWKLSWASPQALLFMFADGGGHYRSMTRSVLETLNAVGAFRFVAAESIVEGALDAVAQTALRNSMQSSY